MAAPHLPPEVAGLIFDKLDLVRDKFAFLAVCSFWRFSVVRGVHNLTLTSSEKAPPGAVANLIAAFHHQQGVTTMSKATPRVFLPRDAPSGSSTLIGIALHTGSFRYVSRDLLCAISRHSNLRSLAIGTEVVPAVLLPIGADADANQEHTHVIVNPQDVPTAEDYERLFAQCVHLREIRFAGSRGIPGEPGIAYHYSMPSGGATHIAIRKLPPHPQDPNARELHGLKVLLSKPNLPRGLGRLPSLTHLHIGPNVFGSHSLTTVARLPFLTSLVIPVDLGLAPSAVRSLTGLHSLDLDFVDPLIYSVPFLDSFSLSFPSSFRLLTRLKNLGIFGDVRLDFQHAPASLETLRLDGWVWRQKRITNMTHLTALTELNVRECRGLVIRSSELSGLCLRVLEVSSSSLQLEESVAEGEGDVRAVFPPNLLQLRMCGLITPLEGSIIACHLRSHLQSLEVLHLPDVRTPSRRQVAPDAAILLPPLPNLVELHLRCCFSLLEQDEGVGLKDKFPALRHLELTECGCDDSFDAHSEENAAVISEALAHPRLTHLTLADFHFSTLPPQCSCPDACEVHRKGQGREQQTQRQQQSAEGIGGVGRGNLKQLSLHGSKTATVRFCVQLPHLQSLHLVGCPLLCSVQPEDKALAALFPSLERIDFRDCGSWEGKEKQQQKQQQQQQQEQQQQEQQLQQQ